MQAIAAALRQGAPKIRLTELFHRHGRKAGEPTEGRAGVLDPVVAVKGDKTIGTQIHNGVEFFGAVTQGFFHLVPFGHVGVRAGHANGF